MSDQITSDTGQPDTSVDRPPESDAANSDTSTDNTPESDTVIAPKKKTRDASAKKAAKRKSSAKSGARGKKRFSRKRFLLALIAFIVVFDTVILSLWFFGGGNEPNVPPHTDPAVLIQGQMSNNKGIAEIGYDSALTFANHTDLTIVNTSSLKPIENDLFKSGAGPGEADLLYDELIVGRTLKLNSDWIYLLNQNDQAVFASVKADSPAYTKISELGAGAVVAYHRLAIGEIRHIGKTFYIITRATYTLTHGGQLDIHDDIFVYKLSAQGNTMVVTDFEQITASTSPSVVPSTPVEEPPLEELTSESEEPTEGLEGDGTFEEPTGEEPEGEGESEGEESFETEAPTGEGEGEPDEGGTAG
jgi:hypothetical protein